ncbi:hypothetical protein RvY_01706 [Ramazzottius varieornatus]|uniref:DDE-1 domain-containing protein n=1 Tax=Ramazzottius varieornatus TaxID=947166 RepID=A0A1D1UL31_RAMVA|nr:hypothetical protein RvY_01706 [Ramazzottius varieornatus]
MTLLALGNAAGKMLLPLILYKGKMHIESHFADTNDECFLSTNSSGVMDPFVLHDYLEKEWSTSITNNKNVLFVDGHSSHLNCIQFLAACMNNSEKEIEFMCLPSGQTAFLQPLDRKVFGGVKQKWTKYLQDSWLDTSVDVTKRDFPSHIVKLWKPDFWVHSFNFTGPLKDGFEKTGIYPFSPELLRDTVDSNLESGPEEVSEEIESQYQQIRRILQERLSISEDETNTHILQIKQVISGKPTASVIAREFHGYLLKAAPKKKRMMKDSRLDTSHGLALVHSGYISLKADKIRASKEAKTKKSNDTAVNRTPAIRKTASVEAKAAAKPSESQAAPVVDPAVSSNNLGNNTVPASKAREGNSAARLTQNKQRC